MNRGWQGLDELTNSFTARILSIDWELGWKEKKKKKQAVSCLRNNMLFRGVVLQFRRQLQTFFVIFCRFIFASTSIGRSVKVFRRRQDNTLELSQVKCVPVHRSNS